MGVDSASKRFRLFGRLADGTTISDCDQSVSVLANICDLSTFQVGGDFVSANGVEFDINLMAYEDTIYAHLSASDAVKLTELAAALRDTLKLEDAAPIAQIQGAVRTGIAEALQPLEDRIKALEQLVFASTARLRCFLSYRFTAEVEPTALRLYQLLSALDIDVITGAEYEPRRISAKVLSKLRKPLDFVVLLISAGGESMWTRDEISAALHHDVPVVPIVEQGERFEPGLFGDIEFIPFAKGHIGDAVLPLLQAIRSVRATRGREGLPEKKNEA